VSLFKAQNILPNYFFQSIIQCLFGIIKKVFICLFYISTTSPLIYALMKAIKSLALAMLIFAAFFANGQNLTIYRSTLSVQETENKFVQLLKEADLVYFETVIHDEIASKRDLKIPPTRVVIFEDPELVTRLIKCNQTTALEMPLKMLIWEENEDVYVGFVDPKLMSKRFLLQDCDDVLDDLARLMVKLASNVIRSS